LLQLASAPWALPSNAAWTKRNTGDLTMAPSVYLDIVLAITFGVIGLLLLAVMPTRYYLVSPEFLKRLELAWLNRGLRTIRKKLLTANEKEFMGRLRKALPEFQVMAQVSMGALMDVAPGSSPSPDRDRFLFASKIVDFVICTPDNEVVALVELDDRTHDVKKDADAQRDALTSIAGYTTIRWDSRRKPSVAEIRKTILNLTAPR